MIASKVYQFKTSVFKCVSNRKAFGKVCFLVIYLFCRLFGNVKLLKFTEIFFHFYSTKWMMLSCYEKLNIKVDLCDELYKGLNKKKEIQSYIILTINVNNVNSELLALQFLCRWCCKFAPTNQLWVCKLPDSFSQ